MIVLSIILLGFTFPVRYLLDDMQWLAYLDLLCYFLMMIFELFLKGSGGLDTLFECDMLALHGAETLLLSTLRVRKYPS